MAVRQFGVEAIIRGVGKFLNDLGKMQGGYDKMNKSASNAGKTAADVGKKLDQANARATAATERLLSAQRNLENTFIRTSATISKAKKDIDVYQQIIDKTTTALRQQGLTQEQVAKLTAIQTKAIEEQTAAIGRLTIATNQYADARQRQQTAQTASERAQADIIGLQQQLAGASGAAQGLTTQALTLGTAMKVLGVAFAGAGLAVGVFGVALGGVRTVVSGIIGVFNSLLDKIVDVGRGIKDFFGKAFEVSAGILIAAVINKITKEITDLSLSVIKAVGDFQLLEIRFAAIAARDIAAEQMIPLSAALELAGDRAKGLLAWVTQLAVKTPFTVNEIAQTLAMANAFGLSSGAAQQLTKATTDFAAAMGLTEDHIYRIIYNFGQMQAQGKLTGREFRDLAVSFVPINEILADMGKRFGKTATEMRELALKGGIPVGTFFKEFVDFAERTFPGAAAKAARTFTGVISNIKDFTQSILGMEVLKPVFDRMTASMADFLDTLLTADFRQAAHNVGTVLLAAFNVVSLAIRDKLIPALRELAAVFGFTNVSANDFLVIIAQFGIGISQGIRAIADLIQTLAKWIGERLGGLSKNGYSWGFNLMASFARGMAAAVRIIVSIISSVARLIAAWFAPGSPPKIAPLIDTWGTKTAEEFIKGMTQVDTSDLGKVGQKAAKDLVEGSAKVVQAGEQVAGNVKQAVEEIAGTTIRSLRQFSAVAMSAIVGAWTGADFELFNTIADKIEQFMRSIPGQSKDDTGLIPRILGTRKAIAEAITGVREGLLSVEDAISRVLDAAGRGSDVFSNYIRALFAVEAAQLALNKAQESYDAISELTVDNLYKIDRLLAKITGALRVQAEQYVSGLMQLAGVEKQLDAQQRVLNETTKKYDAILNDLNAQLRGVTDAFDEQQRLVDINEAIASGLLTRRELEKLQAEKRSIELKQQIRQVEQQRDAEVGAAQDRVDAAQEARDALNDQLEQQRKSMLEIADLQRLAAQDALDTAQAQLDAAQALIDMQIRQNELIQEQIDLLKRLAEQGGGAGGGAGIDTGVFEDLAAAIQSLPSPEDISNRLDSIFTLARLRLRFQLGRIRREFEKAFENVDFKGMGESLQKAWDNLKAWWDRDIAPILRGFTTDVGVSLGSIADSIERIEKALGVQHPDAGWLGSTVSLITFLTTGAIAGTIFGISLAIDAIATSIEGIMKTLDTWTTKLDEFRATWDDKTIGGKIDAFFGLIKAGIETWIGLLKAIFVDPWVGMFTEIKDHWTQFQKDMYGGSIIPETMKGILDAIIAGLDLILVEIPKKVVSATLTLAASLATFIGVIAGLILHFALNPVKDVVENKLGPALESLRTDKMVPLTNYVQNELFPAFVLLKDYGLVPLSDHINDVLILAFDNLTLKVIIVKEYITGTFMPTLDNLIAKIDGLAVKLGIDLTDAIDKAKDKLGLFKDALDGAITSIGTFVSNAGSLVKSMGSIQSAASTAASAVERLNKAIAASAGTKPKTTTTTTTSTTTTQTVSTSASKKVKTLAEGGIALAGRAHIVGEKGPEFFVPKMSGYVLPNELLTRLVKAFSGLSGNMVVSQATQVVYNIDNSTTVNVNASYAKAQSPSSVYWDVTAALASTRS